MNAVENDNEANNREYTVQELCEEHPEYSDLIQVSYKMLAHASVPPATIHRKIKQHIQKWG